MIKPHLETRFRQVIPLNLQHTYVDNAIHSQYKILEVISTGINCIRRPLHQFKFASICYTFNSTMDSVSNNSFRISKITNRFVNNHAFWPLSQSLFNRDVSNSFHTYLCVTIPSDCNKHTCNVNEHIKLYEIF